MAKLSEILAPLALSHRETVRLQYCHVTFIKSSQSEVTKGAVIARYRINADYTEGLHMLGANDIGFLTDTPITGGACVLIMRTRPGLFGPIDEWKKSTLVAMIGPLETGSPSIAVRRARYGGYRLLLRVFKGWAGMMLAGFGIVLALSLIWRHEWLTFFTCGGVLWSLFTWLVFKSTYEQVQQDYADELTRVAKQVASMHPALLEKWRTLASASAALGIAHSQSDPVIPIELDL